MTRVERTPRRGPGGKGSERPETPHVDQPVDAGDGLEAERRDGIENRENEADGVGDSERGRERERQKLAAQEQEEAERQEMVG